MELDFKNYLLKFSIIITVLLAINILIYRMIDSLQMFGFVKLAEIYFFLIFLNIAHFFTIRQLFKKWPKYAGFLFTGLSLLKMGIAIIYLIPYIFPKTEISMPFVLNFMVVYFSTLIFEVVVVAKNMTKI